MWMSIEGHRRLVEVFPDPLQKLWEKWELRGLVFVSLVSQILLSLLGNRRKYGIDLFTKSIVWSAYLMADWVAAFALGVISSKLGQYYDNKNGGDNDINPQMTAFWAPFFLMHIGGPGTITAYSLEDNELWLRHFVGLIAQTSLTFYIILLSWKPTSWLSYLSLPMLVIGFIKYGERTWSLYSASIKHHRDSLLSSSNLKMDSHGYLGKNKNFDAWNLLKSFMDLFVSLFIDVVFSSKSLLEDILYFQQISYEEAFGVVEQELGFAYDVFYTKASVAYTIWGFITQLVTLISTIIVLVLYSIFAKNEQHLLLDCILTYMLLVEAFMSEFYVAILLASSEWANHWLRKRSRSLYIKWIITWFQPSKSKRWSNSFAQYNLLTSCLENKNMVGRAKSLRKAKDLLNINHCLISMDLKQIIFSFFLEKSKGIIQGAMPNNSMLGNTVDGFDSLRWTKRLEFHQSILTWHIATDLCYNSDDFHESSIHSKESKKLSDYMCYLLVKCGYMLPVGTGLVRFCDTYDEMTKFFQQRDQRSIIDVREACRMLLQVETNVVPIEVKEGRSRSVLVDACILAKCLLRMDGKIMWESLARTWIEILGYAATQCRVDNHAQQLRRGGEFISHVWLLQAHLGVMEQFQVMQEEYEKNYNQQLEFAF